MTNTYTKKQNVLAVADEIASAASTVLAGLGLGVVHDTALHLIPFPSLSASALVTAADRLVAYGSLVALILILSATMVEVLTTREVTRPAESPAHAESKTLRAARDEVPAANPAVAEKEKTNGGEPGLFRMARTRGGAFKMVERTGKGCNERWMMGTLRYYAKEHVHGKLVVTAEVAPTVVEAPTFTPVRSAYQPYTSRRVEVHSARGGRSVFYDSKARTAPSSRLGACAIVAAEVEDDEDEDESDAMEDVVYTGLTTSSDLWT